MGALGIDHKALTTFLRAVQRRFPLERAILFGSRARETELCTSDYDIILVSPAFAGMPFTERARAVAESWTLPLPLEVLCYTPDEFAARAAGLTMVREAMETGIELPLDGAPGTG